VACPACQRHSALIAALAPAISRLQPLTRQGLLGLLGLPEKQLLRAAKIEDPDGLSRRTKANQVTESVPTALCRHDPGYPQALAQLDSAPAVLYATCEAERLRALLAAPTVALVGNLAHTGYARQIAFALSHDLAAAAVTVLSGLNDGLEGTAHHGALDAHGQSIAVLPCTPDVPPFPHRDEYLHRCILARGAAVSEFPPGFHPPQRWCYIASQRITAALASITVVIESAERSSALFAAQIAADLGHDVAVVPGRVTDPSAHGTLALLRDGAHPVGSAQDVLELIHGAGAGRVAA
jgi:DNA processing protein